jgi:phosphotriesterase-related protein
VVVTVTGEIDPSAVGIALTHEHILADLSAYFAPDPDPAVAAELAESGVGLTTLGHLRRSLTNCRDDLELADDVLAARELSRFRQRGGQTICELSTHGIRLPRHAERLRAIAAATGLNIILGTGAYVAGHHPPWLRTASEGELAELFTRELTVGVDGTDVRCGLIGEVGLSSPPDPAEVRVLHACAQAQLATGAALIIHQTDPSGGTAQWALGQLTEAGVPAGRIIIGHLGIASRGVIEAVLDQGCFAAIDTIGLSGSFAGAELPSARGYASLIRQLLDGGYANRLLLSQDVAHKRQLRAYGGTGYDHLLADFRGLMSAAGITDTQIGQLLIGNPRVLLGVAAPALTRGNK